MTPKELFVIANNVEFELTLAQITERIDAQMLASARMGAYGISISIESHVDGQLLPELKKYSLRIRCRVLDQISDYYSNLHFEVHDYSRSGYIQIFWDLKSKEYSHLKGGLSLS